MRASKFSELVLVSTMVALTLPGVAIAQDAAANPQLKTLQDQLAIQKVQIELLEAQQKSLDVRLKPLTDFAVDGTTEVADGTGALEANALLFLSLEVAAKQILERAKLLPPRKKDGKLVEGTSPFLVISGNAEIDDKRLFIFENEMSPLKENILRVAQSGTCKAVPPQPKKVGGAGAIISGIAGVAKLFKVSRKYKSITTTLDVGDLVSLVTSKSDNDRDFVDVSSLTSRNWEGTDFMKEWDYFSCLAGHLKTRSSTEADAKKKPELVALSATVQEFITRSTKAAADGSTPLLEAAKQDYITRSFDGRLLFVDLISQGGTALTKTSILTKFGANAQFLQAGAMVRFTFMDVTDQAYLRPPEVLFCQSPMAPFNGFSSTFAALRKGEPISKAKGSLSVSCQ